MMVIIIIIIIIIINSYGKKKKKKFYEKIKKSYLNVFLDHDSYETKTSSDFSPNCWTRPHAVFVAPP